MRTAASGGGDVEFGIAVFAQGEREAVAIGRVVRAGVGAGKFYDSVPPAAREIDLVHVRVAALVAGIDEVAAIGAQAGGDGDGVVVRELHDFRAIDIGGVDFLLAGARADEGDLGGSEAFITGEGLHDLIREAVDTRAGRAFEALAEGGFAAVVIHPAGERTATHGGAGDELRAFRRDDGEGAGEGEVIGEHFRREAGFGTLDFADGDGELVALGDGDDGRLRAVSERGEQEAASKAG